MNLTMELLKKDINSLPKGYKTAHVDKLIRSYVNEKSDVSFLRPYILTHQEFHRIYYYVSLKQITNVYERMRFIHNNLLFEDWWHTDQLISFVSELDFESAKEYAKGYIFDKDPFIRRWGYVMFISKLGRGHSKELLPLLHNDDHYYVQMAEAWLVAELAVFEPEYIYTWLSECDLKYNITGKAIQKICDSFRISNQWKAKFKTLRPILKANNGIMLKNHR